MFAHSRSFGVTVCISATCFLLGCQQQGPLLENPAVPPTEPIPTRSALVSPLLATPARLIEPTDGPNPTPTFDSVASTAIAFLREIAQISLKDKGKTFTYTLTTRFMMFLDDDLYPVKELICEPKPVIGFVSNGFLRGPGHYPVMYGASIVGECTLSVRDFWVKIVSTDRP
jgi:hypothetical protein